MILAGIDEAGLGPKLGPLALGMAALRVPDDWRPETPWTALAPLVTSAPPSRAEVGSVLPVADSKALYTRGGVALLETSVLAFTRLAVSAGVEPVDRETLFAALDATADLEVLRAYPWHAAEWGVPVEVEPAALAALTSELRAALGRAGATVAALRARAVEAGELNRFFASGLNKADTLLVHTGDQLKALAAAFPDEDISVVVDKQGGRDRYAAFLTDLFGGAWWETLTEGRENSTYRLARSAGRLTVCFRPRADAESFATALASMTAKYLRERLMAGFNAWFGARRPGLAPTAGYPGDAPRFLAEVEPVIRSEKLDQARLVRER